jgi:hypothetical protein
LDDIACNKLKLRLLGDFSLNNARRDKHRCTLLIRVPRSSGSSFSGQIMVMPDSFDVLDARHVHTWNISFKDNGIPSCWILYVL